MSGIRSQGVHNKVDPKKLNSSECGSLGVGSYSGDECNDDSGDIDGDLELQELFHGVIDAAAPHNRANNRREVVVHENEPLHETHGFLVCSAVRFCPKLDKKPNHKRGKQEQANQASNFGGQLREGVQF